MKKEKLTPKQKLFCLEYLKTFNATASYKKVYWVSQKTAEANWPRLIENDRVSEFLQDKSQQKIEKEETWVEYVIRNLKEIIEIWMGRQAIELKGKEQKIYDLKNVNSALEKLWKYHKMYTDKIEQDATVQIQIVSYKDKEEWK
jgi:phage terminase small subunit